MKSSVGKGAFVLIVSGFVCKFFGALFRLPLTNIVGIEGIGVFQMIMSLYSLMLVLVTGGVTNSLAKLISSSRARGEKAKIGGYLFVSVCFALGLSLAISLFFAFFSKNISSWQGISDGYASYLLFLILIPIGALIGVFRGVIQGYENMLPTAISQIIEQIVKFAFGLLFAFIFAKSGAVQGVFGAFLGITLSELIAFIYLLFVMFTKMKISPSREENVRAEFLKAVLPLSFGGAVVPFTHAIDSLIIVSLLSLAGLSAEKATALFGLQTGVVGAIFNFPLIISLSVGIALLPKVAFLSGNGQTAEEKRIICQAFSVMWLLLLPLVVGIMSVSAQLYQILYPSSIKGFLTVAVDLSYLSGLAIILTAIMQFVLSLLQAKGHFLYSFLITLLGGISKVAFVVITARIPEVNIFAIPISNIALSLIVCIGGLIKLGKLLQVNYFDILVPVFSSIIMFTAVKIFVSSVALPQVVLLLLSVIIGAIIYLVLNFPLFKKYSLEIIKKR